MAGVEAASVEAVGAAPSPARDESALGKRRDEDSAELAELDAAAGKRSRHGDAPAAVSRASAFDGLVFTAPDGRKISAPRKVAVQKVRLDRSPSSRHVASASACKVSCCRV